MKLKTNRKINLLIVGKQPKLLEVEAIVIGNFGIHHYIEKKDDNFSKLEDVLVLAHIHSGMQVKHEPLTKKKVYKGVARIKTLEKLAIALEKLGDWSLAIPNFNDMGDMKSSFDAYQSGSILS